MTKEELNQNLNENLKKILLGTADSLIGFVNGKIEV